MNCYQRNLHFDILDNGELCYILVNYTHHHLPPRYNSYDSKEDYEGYNYCEVNWVEYEGKYIGEDYGELEQLLLEEFIDKEEDFI